MVNLLALQRGPSAVRTMKVKVFVDMEDGAGSQSDYRKEVKDLMRGIQKELRRATTNQKRKTLKNITSAAVSKDWDARNAVEANANATDENAAETEVIGPIAVPDSG